MLEANWLNLTLLSSAAFYCSQEPQFHGVTHLNDRSTEAHDFLNDLRSRIKVLQSTGRTRRSLGLGLRTLSTHDANKMKDEGKVFVTVGSTLFDALVRAVTTHECLQVLQQLGFSSLVIQLGNGTLLPPKGTGDEENVKVEYFTSAPDLVEHIGTAALVISHAGSGSIFETLRAGRPLVVVVNNLLMDNHQSELAEELSERKFLFCATPETLVETLKKMDVKSLASYPASDPSELVKSLDQFLGFHNS